MYEVWNFGDLWSRHNDRREAERTALGLWRMAPVDGVPKHRRIEVWEVYDIGRARLVRAYGAR